MSKAFFVGDRVSTLAFRPLGVKVLEAEDPDSALMQVTRAVNEVCTVLLVTEECARWAEDALEPLRARSLPAVAVLPGASSPGGGGQERLKRNVEKALGSSMILQVAEQKGV